MYVKKRDGETEEYSVEKIHRVVEWAIEDLNGVSLSDIEMNANLSLHDGIATEHALQFWMRPGRRLLLKLFVSSS